MKKGVSKKVRNVVYNSTTKAALNSYAQNGSIPVTVTALIKDGDEMELVPVLLGGGLHDIRLVSDILDKSLDGVVAHIKESKDARVVMFMLAAEASGTISFKKDGHVEGVKAILTAARTEDREGKTTLYQVVDEVGKTEYVALKTATFNKWIKGDDTDDLASVVSQKILDSLWVSFVTKRNLI